MKPLYFLIALQVLDLATTLLCLRTGKAREANPILVKLFELVGVVPSLLLVKGALIAILIWTAPQTPQPFLWVLVIGYVWVVYNNVKVFRGVK
jgi:hypothetical protein